RRGQQCARSIGHRVSSISSTTILRLARNGYQSSQQRSERQSRRRANSTATSRAPQTRRYGRNSDGNRCTRRGVKDFERLLIELTNLLSALSGSALYSENKTTNGYMEMAWAFLCIAGILEIAFAISMKSSDGFTRLVPALLTVCTGVASVILLSLSLRELPVGTGYAVWTGIGAAGTAALGIAV